MVSFGVFCMKVNCEQSSEVVSNTFPFRNKLFVGTILIKNGTISMKVGTIAVR